MLTAVFYHCTHANTATSFRVRHCILKGNFGETRPPVLRLLKDSDVQMKQGQPDKVMRVYMCIHIMYTAIHCTTT
jgi:hypothetical protein